MFPVRLGLSVKPVTNGSFKTQRCGFQHNAVVFTWVKGEFQTPKIAFAGLGNWVFENGFAVIVDEKGLKVKAGGTEVRLNLPQDMPISKRICDGQLVVPDLPSKKMKALGFREISAKGLIVGKPQPCAK